jgi:Fe-Mn family superoxide dismutase
MNLALAPLPYAIDALEPHLSRRTLLMHHEHHHAGYLEKTRRLIQRTSLEHAPLERIVSKSARSNQALFEPAAQAWNHEFYFRSMSPDGGGKPQGAVAHLISAEFGSHAAFCQHFLTAAGELFGSGWVWLVMERDRLRILSTSNAGTPLVERQLPLLTIDLWEHAYYLDYQYRKLDYVAAFIAHLVDWDFANRNLELGDQFWTSGPAAARQLKTAERRLSTA